MASYQAYGPQALPNAPYDQSSSSRYPPTRSRYDNSSLSLSDDDATVAPLKKTDATVVTRQISRTPSPSPSEVEELSRTQMIDWKAMANWKYWFRKDWTWYYVAFAIALIIGILFTVYHEQIVRWMQPAANWMHGLTDGWLIPIAIMFVISFPPLFGQEIVAILCGLVWGLWGGFAIVAAGTFLGELANFFAFRYCCAARGEKLERTQIKYACLADVVRNGGFRIAIIARYSAIPGHFTTAVFSTCGMSVYTFALAAFLSLPKQFMTVYLGVALEDSETGQSSTKDTIIKDTVIGITTIVTIVAMWYIYKQMNLVKPEVIYQRRKARQAKMMAGAMPYGTPSMMESNTSFNPNASDPNVPLNSSFPGGAAYQQWDANGRAVGYVGDPNIHVPVPRRAPSRPPVAGTTHRPQETTMSERGYSTPPSRQGTWEQQARSPMPASRSPAQPPLASPFGSPAALDNPYDNWSSGPPVQSQSPGQTAYAPRFTASPAHEPASAPPVPAYAPQPGAEYAAALAQDPSTAPARQQHFGGGGGAPAAGYFHAPSASEVLPDPYAVYDSSSSVQSQAGSLPPAYSATSLR